MYRAKTTGKSRFRIFGKKLHQMAHDGLQLENDLKTALAKNQFTLYYQPIVFSKTGIIKGFEALIRWEHPTRGMIPPSDFIPVAENNGQIIPIGQWVIETACRQLKAWQDKFPDHKHLTVSVNISVQQCSYNNLEIAKAIITLAQSLNLEVIAEGIESNEQLETLQGMGCDFIQGYYFSKPVDSRHAERLISEE